jgi:hypothetical protein
MMMRNAMKSVASSNLLVSFSISWMTGGTVPVNAFPWSHNDTTVQCLRQQISNKWTTKIVWRNQQTVQARNSHKFVKRPIAGGIVPEMLILCNSSPSVRERTRSWWGFTTIFVCKNTTRRTQVWKRKVTRQGPTKCVASGDFIAKV